MPKITYVDENNTFHKFKGKIKNRTGVFIVLFLILSFVMGIVGGVGALLTLASSPTLKDKLGIDLKNLNISKTTNEKLVLEESSAIIDSTKKVSPAVVSIVTTQDVMNVFGQVMQQEGAGTGFIFTNDGYILTNKHVGSDVNGKYTVLTADGKKYDGKVVAQDPSNDLAIIKIDAKGLPVVDFGDSNNLEIGQWVIAIGNALGQLQNTVTVGVISARERQLTAGGEGDQTEKLENLLQTDAAINPGNSGGPLVNLKGQVIAINTAIAGGAQGIGFAIPINTAKTAISSFQKSGKIVRPVMGVRYVPVDSDVKQAADLPIDYGAYISGNYQYSGIVAGGPADKAGLRDHDIITAINGQKIDSNNPLGTEIQKYNPGDTIEVTYLRDGKENKTKLKLSSTE